MSDNFCYLSDNIAGQLQKSVGQRNKIINFVTKTVGQLQNSVGQITKFCCFCWTLFLSNNKKMQLSDKTQGKLESCRTISKNTKFCSKYLQLSSKQLSDNYKMSLKFVFCLTTLKITKNDNKILFSAVGRITKFCYLLDK